ncbi:MAG: beta-lactamase family protein [Cytophagaceae bacterium]|nr:beta-lactamase family protein [Gemmatimonadaceae bacterium]
MRQPSRRPVRPLAAIAVVALLLTFSVPLAAQQSNPRFDALVALAEAKMKEFGVPGVALGIVHDGTVTIRGIGVTNVEDPLPVTAHTVFPIASISKTFTATAMMRLVEQGKVDLRAPVRRYLPDFRVRDEAVSRDVTVWHLLTHLGGWEGQVSAPDRGSETLRNFITTTIPNLMQVAPPGAAWSYNNAGFAMAGRVIEVATDATIHRAMRDLVFQPMGLEHAGTTAGDFIVQRFAAGHGTRDGVTTLNRPFTPSVGAAVGGVGLCMTDLLAYARFHLGDGTVANGTRVLTRESLERMRTPQVRKQSTDDDIGIGWHLRSVGGVRTASHGGTLGGHILLLELAPERNFAIAILTNSSTGWRLIQDVEREALKSYLGASFAPNQGIAHRGLVETLPTTEPLARQPELGPYVGTYARPSNTVVVRVEGARLLVQERSNSGAPGREMPIAFFGPDRAVVTDGAERGQSVEFVKDDAGRVRWVRVVGRVAVRSPDQ